MVKLASGEQTSWRLPPSITEMRKRLKAQRETDLEAPEQAIPITGDTKNIDTTPAVSFPIKVFLHRKK